MGDKLRIYVGGLGSNVKEDDLRKTFTSSVLGDVESVEIIRSKDRSFGYLEFVPVSEKGLAKLFSTYNGCLWKGGRLKLEKAKEHYMSRLRREWTEESELANKLASQKDDASNEKPLLIVQKGKKDQDVEQANLHIFFPKLRKIKPLPLKGTGKHKYSFQRVEIPPLPINFCDCEEHSVPQELAKKKFSPDHDQESCGVNEEELSMVKSVLNKLLEGENSSKLVLKETESISKEEFIPLIGSADNLQAEESEEDEVSDEDGLVINIVSRKRKAVSPFKDWGQKKNTSNQDSLVKEPHVLTSRHNHEMHGSQKQKPVPENKRKAPLYADDTDVASPSKKKARNKTGDLKIAMDTQPAEAEKQQKSGWKNLVKDKKKTAFHISDILADQNNPQIEVELKPDNTYREKENPVTSENLKVPKPHKNLEKPEKVENPENPLSKDESLEEKLSDIQSTKPSMVDKVGRGASWLHKSSWTQLVATTKNTSFSLAEFLPVGTLEKQEYSEPVATNASSSSRIDMNQNYSVEYSKNVQGSDNMVTNGALSEDLELLNSDKKQTVEQEDVKAVPARVPIKRTPVRDIVISETCPFMRSAESMKEWAKTKAAISGSLKKKEKGKETGK